SAGREEERVAKAPSASADGGGRAPVNPAPPSGWDLEASARAGERDRERLAAMSDREGERVGQVAADVIEHNPEAADMVIAAIFAPALIVGGWWLAEGITNGDPQAQATLGVA